MRNLANVVAAEFLATAAVVSALLHDSRLADRWTQPSALRDFRISGLAGHLGRAVFNVERYLDAPVPAGVDQIDAVRYFLTAGDPQAGPEDPTQRHIRARGEQAAGTGATDLADRFDAARARLEPRLADLPSEHPVLVFDRWAMPLDQCLITRLIELAVHLDDLAVSLGVPTPDIPDEAADVVVTTLARIARAHHGTVPLLRALSRRERAPGVITAF
ncbi:maleylpyruvate isomerase N-terminal domain-containing protein [Micromonospora sp. KC721]|uniref:maleylpyruvate isomerase N-terminal domain-containing protein n=1 Tax=Micromonospora sp. KC721 TaxID=2530380 RepID=UPI0014048FAD|nr:maleylpyruvate isomerase N-terminal domain-containing protein [Micromonospora sp. KC721]